MKDILKGQMPNLHVRPFPLASFMLRVWDEHPPARREAGGLRLLLRPFEGISQEVLGLFWFESPHHEALHSRCDTLSSFPLFILSCKCQHESSGLKEQYQDGRVSCPAVTFRAVFKSAVVVVGTRRGCHRSESS